jgi:hypothetical protein
MYYIFPIYNLKIFYIRLQTTVYTTAILLDYKNTFQSTTLSSGQYMYTLYTKYI